MQAKTSTRKEVKRLEMLLAQNSATVAALISLLVRDKVLREDSPEALMRAAMEIMGMRPPPVERVHPANGETDASHVHSFEEVSFLNGEMRCACGERFWKA